MTIGETIKARRQALGWSVTRLSRETGIDIGNLGRIERGDTKSPRKDTLKRIGNALGVNLLDEPVQKPESWKKQGYIPRYAICRKATGRTQSQAAETLRVAKGTLKSWETGETSPSAWVLIRMARLYGVSVDYLIGNDEKPYTGLRCAIDGPCAAGKPIDYCCRDCPSGKTCPDRCTNSPDRCRLVRKIRTLEEMEDMDDVRRPDSRASAR